MARFLAEIEGQSGKPVHRLGSPASGVRAQAQGWDIGVTVYADVSDDNEETYTVYMTGGSNGSSPMRIVGQARLVDGVPEWTPLQD